MNKIKILCVIGTLNYTNGVTSYAMNYYRNIDRNNFEFIFIVHDSVLGEYYDEIIKNGDKVYLIDNLKINKVFKLYKDINRIFKENDFDIIHCHLLNVSPFYFFLANKYKIKVKIVHSHATQYAEKKSRILRNKILGKLGVKMATHRFACSDLAGKFLYKEKAYSLIKNAVNIDKYKFDEKIRNKIRKQYNISNDDVIIGHIGRFSEQKNHEYLLDIISELLKENKKYKLMLLGDGHLYNKIVERSKENNLYDSIIFVGNVSDAYKYYNAFDIFVLPSLFEGLPVVGIEAQVNGLPCIFSNTISEEVKINDNVNFLSIESCNVKKWVDKIVLSDLNRELSMESIINCGYDIKCASKKLEEEYQLTLE